MTGIVDCYVCKRKCSPFYLWSSSRYFPREKLIKMKGIKDKTTLKKIHNGTEVCFICYNKLMKENIK